MLSEEQLREIARGMQQDVVKLRRKFHANPELRWQEKQTAREITLYCNPGLLFKTRAIVSTSLGEIDGGIFLNLTFKSSFDRILFRADIDAMPVQEKTGLPFASVNPGVSHACGHDTHIAMLLGAMTAIAKGLVVPKHNLRIVFQRAEENPGTYPNTISGGDSLVQEGILNGVSAAYALHIWNNPEPDSGTPGVFYSRPGPFMGNSGRLKMMIKCSGGHAAKPNGGVNALRITQVIQNALDSIATRTLGPFEPVALEPVIGLAGTAGDKPSSNVMPHEAELWYGCRTVLPRDKHNEFMGQIEETVRAIVQTFPGASVEFTRILGHPALINNPESFRHVKSVLEGLGETVQEHERILGGEDFAHYLYGVPGCMFMLGAHGPNSGGDHHSPTFNPDESVLWKGVLFWLALACN